MEAVWLVVQVEKDGKVGPLPGWEHFPDTDAPVVGAPSITLPDSLTG
jgi:phospholipase D1/2